VSSKVSSQRDQPTNHPSNPPNQPTSQNKNFVIQVGEQSKNLLKQVKVRNLFFFGPIVCALYRFLRIFTEFHHWSALIVSKWIRLLSVCR
jgi:hypothetical protein